MEVDELLLQNLADEWAKPKMKEKVEREVDSCKSLIISGLEEDHISAYYISSSLSRKVYSIIRDLLNMICE